jgi:phenylpropionate dioxygenase-like ring-hydroxylating dioxygenase large terminal subunit
MGTKACLAPLGPLPAEIEALCNDVEAALDDGVLPVRIFNDQEVHRLELERIFSRTWTYVGHESEIPDRGDYVLRYIGEDPFILVRDEQGEVRLLFDACRHRGTQICRADRGNTSHFRCPYHGWTYKNTGALVGMPSAGEVYRGLNRADWGLLEAPKLEARHGLYFACLDPEAPSLTQFLGDMAYYFDMCFGYLGEMEVVGTPYRWIMGGNWKTTTENAMADDYHVTFLHRSMVSMGFLESDFFRACHHISPGNGHGVSFEFTEPGVPAEFGYPSEIASGFGQNGGLTPEQAALASRCLGGGANVFPNFSLLFLQLSPTPQLEGPTAFTSVRLWQPHGPDQVEMWNWILVPKGASAEFREKSYRAAMATFSPGGMFEQDDTIAWRSIARTAGSVFARRASMRFNYQMGDQVGARKTVDDWPGPGWVSAHAYEESLHRMLYLRWLDFLRSPDYPSPRRDERNAAGVS